MIGAERNLHEFIVNEHSLGNSPWVWPIALDVDDHALAAAAQKTKAAHISWAALSLQPL